MNLTVEDKDRIIEMAWEDRTTFEDIKMQFDLDEQGVIRAVNPKPNQLADLMTSKSTKPVEPRQPPRQAGRRW